MKLSFTNLVPESMHSLSKVYIEQASISLIIRVFSILISFVYVPIVLDYLSQEKYGIWITLTTIVNWIRVLDVGMGNGMRNKLSESLVLHEHKKAKIFISTTFGILGSIFCIVLVLFFISNTFIDWQLVLNTEILSRKELFKLTNFVVPSIIISFILQPVTLIYDAYGKSSVNGLLQLAISILSLIFILIASKLNTGGDIILLAYIITGLPTLVYLAAFIYTFFYKHPELRPSFKYIRFSESQNLLNLSLQFFVLQITATIVFSSIPFIVAHLFSPNEVTIYNITNSLFNIPIMVMTLIATPLLPLVTQAYTKKDFRWLSKMLRNMNLLSLIVSGGIILLTFLSPYIFEIWLRKKVSIPFELTFSIAIYSIINVLTIPFSIFINGIGKIRILVILAPLGIALFIGLSIILSKLIGNVIAVSISLSINSLIGLIAIPIILKKNKILQSE